MNVCFIGYEISNVFEGEILGGAQKQQALIIQGLKAKGIGVIVLEYYLKEPKIIDEVYFYPAWNKRTKSFVNRLREIINKLKEHDVNIIYVRGTQLYVAFLYLILKTVRSKIKLFWGIAGDHDLTSKYNYLRVNNVNSLYGKINAGVIFNLSSLLSFYFSDTIICQTQEQIERCKTISKNKSTILISNIYSSNLNDKISNYNKISADAIWKGKFSGNKGEDILLNIARDIPKIKIICLGHETKNFKKTRIFEQIKKQKNLILLGRVNIDKVSRYISQVDFILNTSPSEGLSNVFLEGWDLEKPIISFKVNPNQYLTKGEAGFCAKNSYSDLIKKLD